MKSSPWENHRLQDLVRNIAGETDSQESTAFSDRLTRKLAEVSRADLAIVSRVLPAEGKMQSVSIFRHGEHLENLSYSLNHSPCAQTIEQGFALYGSGVIDRFPDHSMFRELGTEAFIGQRLSDCSGNAIGVIALFYNRPIEDPQFLEDLLKVCAVPAAMELERLHEQSSREILEQRLNSILGIAKEAIISVDENANIILFNEGAAAIFGYGPDELIGQPINMLLPEHLREKHKAQIQGFASGPEISRLMSERNSDIVAQRKNGEIFPAEASITKTITEENTTITVVLRDITERQQSERALQSASRMQTLGNLAAGLAHDFNNILTVIRGSLDLLGSKSLTEEKTRHYLKVAANASDRGTELVSRLLAFGRPRSLQPEAINPAELIDQLIDMLRVTLGEHIHVEYQRKDNNCLVFADPSQLENAIVNLCFNARDAMKSGGSVTLSLDCTEVDNELSQALQIKAGHYARIKVQDNGSGMSEEAQANALEPFYSTKLETGGSGLGLSMVMGFVKSVGGAVKIESIVGQGTTVTVYLPVNNASELQPAINEDEDTNANGTILVVEDQPEIREIAVLYAESLGYNVLEAEDGVKGLEIIKSNPDIDLLFTDYQLPGGVSGLDLANIVQESYPHMKTLISSGYGTQHVDLAKFPLLPKPYSLSTFTKYIKSILED